MKQMIAEAIAAVVPSLTKDEILSLIEIPPNPEMGASRKRADQISTNDMISSTNDYLSFFSFE